MTYINQREYKDTNADLYVKFYESIQKEIKKEIKNSQNKKAHLTVIKNGTKNN